MLMDIAVGLLILAVLGWGGVLLRRAGVTEGLGGIFGTSIPYFAKLAPYTTVLGLALLAVGLATGSP